MNKKKHTEVEFKYFAPGANEVCLAGTFNHWSPSDIPLSKDKEGYWRVKLDLAPGRYEYRYVVDGSWENEQDPSEMVPNPFGTWNCVITVE